MSSSPKLRRQAARRGLSPPPSLLDRFLAFLSPFQNLPTPWWPCPMRRIPEPLPYQRLPPRRGATPNGPRRVRRPWARQSAGAGACSGSGAGARAQAARAPDARADAEGAADQPAEPLRAAGRGVQHGRVSKATMMPLERRNEPQMLRSFWKQYPSYRVQPLLYLEGRRFGK